MREIRMSGLMRGSDGADLFVTLLSTLLVKVSPSDVYVGKPVDFNHGTPVTPGHIVALTAKTKRREGKEHFFAVHFFRAGAG